MCGQMCFHSNYTRHISSAMNVPVKIMTRFATAMNFASCSPKVNKKVNSLPIRYPRGEMTDITCYCVRLKEMQLA